MMSRLCDFKLACHLFTSLPGWYFLLILFYFGGFFFFCFPFPSFFCQFVCVSVSKSTQKPQNHKISQDLVKKWSTSKENPGDDPDHVL